MKKSILVVFALMSMYFLSSCQKEDLNDLVSQISNSANKTSLEPENLPSTIIEYVDNNFFETYIEEAWEASGLGYELKMGNEESIYFDSTNEFLEPSDRRGRGGRGHGGHHGGPCGNGGGEAVAVSDLPTSITDYVAANYADAEIKRAGIKNEDTYIVGLLIDGEKVILAFDLDGNFIEEVSLPEGAGDPVAVSDLPTSITDYVAANYADAEIKRAKNNADGQFIIGLTGKIVLVFDADGNFVEELPFIGGNCGCGGQEIETAELPTSVTDYIVANYPTAEIKKAHQKDDKYVVGLFVDGERVILIFDADGNFLFERN